MQIYSTIYGNNLGKHIDEGAGEETVLPFHSKRKYSAWIEQMDSMVFHSIF